ncbi:MAG: hypothetical protein R3E45_01875 [Rhodocyclaceae bacterium]
MARFARQSASYQAARCSRRSIPEENTQRLRFLRPALNYYCISTRPHGGHRRTEPLHQRARPRQSSDGIPARRCRAWGGLTTPDELRAIANAAEKYKVPTVKVTGGQRIDLLTGVKKEDLPLMIWHDLSGHGPATPTASRLYREDLHGAERRRFSFDGASASSSRRCCSACTARPHKVKLQVGCLATAPRPGIKDGHHRRRFGLRDPRRRQRRHQSTSPSSSPSARPRPK